MKVKKLKEELEKALKEGKVTEEDEDNAEFGYGMQLSYNANRAKIKSIMESELDTENKEVFKKWLDNYDDYKIY